MPASTSSVRASMKASRYSSPDGTSSSADAGTSKAVKTILNSRKCWRNMKGKEEAVWPPELEAALIEGLEKYRPAEAKSNRVLGRFPMRNKFVADHILETTGQRRTPKQVGSRIQQLRDTSSGKQILKAISDKHYEMMHPKGCKYEQREGDSSSLSNSLSQQASMSPLPMMPALSHIYINTLPPRSAWCSRSSSPIPPTSIHLQDPRPLCAVDPTVSFTSLGHTPCQAVFQVHKDGLVVQQEYAPVTISCNSLSESSTSAPMLTYSTALVPQYWSYLCEVEDVSAYTIYLEVVRLPFSTVSPASSPVLLSALYHFVDSSVCTFTASTPPLSPRSSCGENDFDFPALSSESSPSPLWDSVTLDTPPLGPMLGFVDSNIDGLPELVFNLEDECSRSPNTPFDFTTMDSASWSYTSSAHPPSPLSSSSSTCDSYSEAAALFDAFVYQ